MSGALISKPGLSGATALAIPKDWDKTWFRNFIQNQLKGADVRNAIGANGITVSGTIASPYATISLGSGPIVLTPGGVGYTLTIDSNAGRALAVQGAAGVSGLIELAGNGNTLGTNSLAVGQSAAGQSIILARAGTLQIQGASGVVVNAATSGYSFTVNSNAGQASAVQGSAGVSALIELAGNGNTLGTTSLAIGQSATGQSIILARAGTLQLQGATGINITNITTTTTAPGAGGAGALPATPKGYFTLLINGVSQQVAYY